MAHKTASTEANEGVLKETAKAIGGAAGKLAALANSVLPQHEESKAGQDAKPAPAKKKIGKLPPTNKTRLPRKEKKMLARRKTA